jgi:hypothetical protein
MMQAQRGQLQDLIVAENVGTALFGVVSIFFTGSSAPGSLL